MQHGRRLTSRLLGTRTIPRHAITRATVTSAPAPARAITRIGITGTDTGVGKTVVSAAIIAALAKSGMRVGAMKPAETGSGTDAETLRAAAGNRHPIEVVRPYLFQDPLAPLVAARRARTRIDTDVIDRAFATLDSTSDAVVVEGAGGLMVPITETVSFANLFAQWKLEVVIVAANRLGVVNHTLLTVDAAQAHGLTIRAVILNRVSDERPDLAQRTNEALLKELLLNIPVVSFPYTKTPHDFLQLALLARDFSTQTLRRS